MTESNLQCLSPSPASLLRVVVSMASSHILDSAFNQVVPIQRHSSIFSRFHCRTPKSKARAVGVAKARASGTEGSARDEGERVGVGEELNVAEAGSARASAECVGFQVISPFAFIEEYTE